MKHDTTLRQDPSGAYWLEQAPASPRRVLTVADAGRRLRRGRRQVYRLMKEGRLGPAVKLLGEWLLDLEAVEALARAPLTLQPLPARLKPLFPEYEAKSLNAGRDGVLVVTRVLESGGLKDLRWLFKRYDRAKVKRVIEDEGARLLSARSRRLWSLVLGAAPRPLADWRRGDPWRGAAA